MSEAQDFIIDLENSAKRILKVSGQVESKESVMLYTLLRAVIRAVAAGHYYLLLSAGVA